VAAPTAALHFTPELIRARRQGHRARISDAACGAGTFLPVKADDTTDQMHAEWGTISPKPLIA
jgi:S-adenosylmethionine:tRNA ribosyltransferase-isomerase